MEWLEYHMLLGVQYFVLISNDCEEADWQALSAAVRPYQLAGEVHLEDMYGCVPSLLRPLPCRRRRATPTAKSRPCLAHTRWV